MPTLTPWVAPFAPFTPSAPAFAPHAPSVHVGTRDLTWVQNLLAENKRAILVGTAVTVLAIGGVTYYASSSQTDRDDDVDSEKGEKRKDKKKSKGKKKKSVKDKDGPLLEEHKSKARDSKTDSMFIIFFIII